MLMLIGLISDTHGHVAFTLEALAEWPTHYVFGNCDVGLETELRSAITRAGHTCHERFGELEVEGQRIAWLHGDDQRRLQTTISSGQYNIVCSGHTHVARKDLLGNTLAINPGAVYRANPRSFALLELPSRELTGISLDG